MQSHNLSLLLHRIYEEERNISFVLELIILANLDDTIHILTVAVLTDGWSI